MYRPTVRYNDAFKDYVEELFKATTLDRNQILRLALYELHKSEKLKEYQKDKSSSLPSPVWMDSTDGLWLTNTMEIKEREEGRHENVVRPIREVTRQPRKVYEQESEIDTSGVRIIVGSSILLPRRTKA